MPMCPDASVTQWIDRLKAGDPDAAQKLWERYFRRLVGLARKRLRAAPRRAADEEDVALSAFDSFCRGAEQDRFPQLHDRLDLWQLLVLVTARKAVDLAQHERRQKRGGGGVLDEAALPGPAHSSADGAALEQIAGPEPTPAFAAQVAEEYGRLPLAREVEAAYQRFESAWRAGRRPPIEDYLGSLPGPARAVLLRELLELEVAGRRRAGETVPPEDYRQRFPEHAALIGSVFRE